MFDLTKKYSFELADKWFQEIKSYNDKISIVLCGNKCDINDSEVSYEESMELAERYNSKFISTSAKMNINIDNIFTTIANGKFEFSLIIIKIYMQRG